MDWKDNGTDTVGNQHWFSGVVEHGVRDSKNRAIGGYVTINSFTNGTVTRFALSLNATRDGKKFGALPRRSYADTLEDAKSVGEKKLGEQGKRYARMVAKGEGKQFARKVHPTCGDCGQAGETAGHQTCQYPQDRP